MEHSTSCRDADVSCFPANLSVSPCTRARVFKPIDAVFLRLKIRVMNHPSTSGDASLRMSHRMAGCLKTAMESMGQNRWADALERLAAAAIADIQQDNGLFLGGIAGAALMAELYQQCFAGSGLKPAPRRLPERGARRPLRLAYVLQSIAAGQSASMQIARMVELFDRALVEPVVIAAEELTARTPPGIFLSLPEAPSQKVGAELISRMRAAGAAVHLVPTSGSYLDGAAAAISLARGLNPDVAAFVGSPACPIQAAMAFGRVAPLQVNHNIGVCLPIAGMDAILYHHPGKAAEDRGELERRGIDTVAISCIGCESAGTDVTAVSRAQFQIPETAVLLLSIGNKLPERFLAGDFARHLAEFMQSHPDVWWLGVGRGDLEKAIAPCRKPASPTAQLHGATTTPHAFMKAADILINEYPEGGGSTVMEAMTCGIPVAAMAAGRQHGHNIGAYLVGPEYAIDTYDPARYWSLVDRWCGSSEERRAAGERLRQRVRERFDFAAICREYEGYFVKRFAP